MPHPHGRETRLCLAPILFRASLTLTQIAVISACRDRPATTNAPEGADVDGAPSDSAPAAPSVDASSQCTSSFQVGPDCKHPTVEASCKDGYCRIPRGCFVSGSPECQPGRGAYSEPEAQVTLTHSFEIGQHEVTQEEWVRLGFENRTPVKPAQGFPEACLDPTCPVQGFTWFDALLYANAASRAHEPPLPECYSLRGCEDTGGPTKCAAVVGTPEDTYTCRGFRLPTEAEWEYAARAGTRTPYYSGAMLGSQSGFTCREEPALSLIAWYCASSLDPAATPPVMRSHPVMQKAPNGWGLYDMLGNFSEWTSDPYDGLGLRAGPYVNPGRDLGTSRTRSKRGGTFISTASHTTVSVRLGAAWDVPDSQGLRLARTLD